MLTVCAIKAQAQLPISGVHYAAGLAGIKGGSLPGPGLYAGDNNFFCYGTSDLVPDYKSFIYLQAPQLTWITPWKILGANYGMNVMVPLIYNDTRYKEFQGSPSIPTPIVLSEGLNRFGVGDIEIEPLLLSWHLQQFDFTAGYGFWAPTGDYNNSSLVNLGDGLWTQMITLGGTWYLDHEKTWAFSILNHFEFNSQVPGILIGYQSPASPAPVYHPSIPCSTYTMEWGASKTVYKKIDVGIVGYYQQQFMYQNGAAAFNDSQVAAIGPEIRSEFPGIGLAVSLRYEYQFLADNSPHGQMVDFRISKQF